MQKRQNCPQVLCLLSRGRAAWLRSQQGESACKDCCLFIQSASASWSKAQSDRNGLSHSHGTGRLNLAHSTLGLGALMPGVTCVSTAATLCSKQWWAFGVVLGGKRKGGKTSDVLDTVKLDLVQSAGGLCLYYSAGPCALPMSHLMWGSLQLLGGPLFSRDKPNTSQSGSIFGCCAAVIGLQAASCWQGFGGIIISWILWNLRNNIGGIITPSRE